MHLGVALMDSDHDNLDVLFQKACACSDENLPTIYREILAEVTAHFLREEAMMEASGFPGIECHRNEHRFILDRLVEDGAADVGTIRRCLIATAPELVREHIETIDYVTAAFLLGSLESAAAGA